MLNFEEKVEKNWNFIVEKSKGIITGRITSKRVNDKKYLKDTIVGNKERTIEKMIE